MIPADAASNRMQIMRIMKNIGPDMDTPPPENLPRGPD